MPDACCGLLDSEATTWTTSAHWEKLEMQAHLVGVYGSSRNRQGADDDSNASPFPLCESTSEGKRKCRLCMR